MFPVSGGSGPPPFPAIQDSPRFLALQGIFPVSSLLSSYCLLSFRFCVFGRPPPAAAGHPSYVRWRIPLQPSGWMRTKCPSPGVLLSVLYACLHPPSTCAAGGTWLGCGWRGRGDGAPRDGLESLDALAGVARDSMPSSTLEFPL